METNRTNERSKKDFEKMVKGTVYLKDKKPGNPPLGRWLYSSNKKFSFLLFAYNSKGLVSQAKQFQL